jgi:ankyrin repeat protein
LLLDNKANPNGFGSSAGPLHSAAFYGRGEVAELLLAHGADINRTDSNGETPLHRAAFRQKADVVRLLLEEGASVNVTSTSGSPRTALDMTDNPEITALIRSHGGKPGKPGSG